MSHPPVPCSGVDPQNLPGDVSHCHAIIRELLTQVGQLQSENLRQQSHLEKLIRARYGQKADRIAPGQTLLFEAQELLDLQAQAQAEAKAWAEAEAAAAVGAAASSPRPPRKGHGRRKLPKDLPRERVVHDIPPEERRCPCCGEEMTCIGEDVSEQLDYEPASVKVLEHVRKKYACRKEACDSKVKTAEKPVQPIEKGLPGPGLLAHVITSKYADHLPLYRQEGILERHGIHIPRSTTCGWMAAAAELLLPLYVVMKVVVRKSRRIGTDDTPVKVLDLTLTKTRTGRIWAYVGDREHPCTVFDYTANRKRDGPATFLDGYEGYLQADAYGGYDGIYAGKLVIEVACWAHARRYFVDAQTTDPARAVLMVGWIRLLYDVEDAARGRSDEERLRLRQGRSRPILEAIRKWLEEELGRVLPKSPIGEAIAYTLNNWTALNRYTEAGFLEIDNNEAERALRSIAVGRNNWLFYGSDKGGRTAAILCSFVATCKRHGVDPLAYLRDVLARISAHPRKRIDDLLPDRWKALREAAAHGAAPAAATPA